MPRALIVEIFGDARQFGAELDRAAGKTRQFGKAAGFVGVAALGLLAVGIEKSVKAAMAGQVSQAQLDTALKNTHQSLVAMKGPLEAAEAASRKLGFTDDDTRAALAKLETATGNTKKSITDLSVAQDVARFKGIDLTDATKTLTTAMGGSQRAAKQLGIIVQPVTEHMDALKASHVDLTTESGRLLVAHAKLLDKMATGQAVIDVTSAKVKGQGQAFANTAEGGTAQFHAQLQHLEELIGQKILPAFNKVVQWLADITAWLSVHLPPAFHVMHDAAKLTINGTRTIVEDAWAVIGPIFRAMKAVVEKIGDALHAVHSAADTTFAALKAIVKTTSSAINGSIGGIIGAFQSVIGVLNDIIGVAQTAFGWISKVLGGSGDLSKSPTGGGPRAPLKPPPRAAGGPVLAGASYLVGERGPEIFTPGRSGVITPNGGSMTPNVGAGSTFVFNFPQYLGAPQEIAAVVRRELTGVGRRNPDIFGGLA